MNKPLAWLLAARPKTLPAAASPVILASALAASMGLFQLVPALLCLGFALSVQVATNYANDYFDFIKGADSSDRIGPRRAVASAWISPGAMLRGTILTLIFALACGLPLIHWGGWPLVIVGTLSLSFAILYTGGPYPLAYVGLGDVFVLIFFGWVAVVFTVFVQTGCFSFHAFLLGTAIGALSVNLLLVNNYRDRDSDRLSGKRTSVVRFGRRWGRAQYRLALYIAIAATAFSARTLADPIMLLPALLLLPAFRIPAALQKATTPLQYDRLLKRTVLFLILWTLAASAVLLRTSLA